MRKSEDYTMVITNCIVIENSNKIALDKIGASFNEITGVNNG